MFESILLAHLARYPAMQLADVYKLIHQAAMGSEHAVRDEKSARDWLTRELAGMGEGLPEPLIDPLSGETGIARVHLRPYVASGGDPAKLLKAFVRTANQYNGSTDRLERYWAEAIVLSESGQLPFSVPEMRQFFEPLKAQNFPAVHHSSEYERLYHPAYRVIQQEFFPFMLTLEEFFAEQVESRQLFNTVRSAIDAIGPSQLRISKSQLSFRRRVAFATVWMPGQYLKRKSAPLVLTLSFRHKDTSPRWKQIVEPKPGRFTHHLELYTKADIDAEVRGWLREAWAAAA